jgi:iron-sulfur cluster repair protein YtfE (RIC family)
MNAVDLLKADHERVNRLFKQVRDTPKGEHPALFKQIYAELDVHTQIEEKIFYPALLKQGDKPLNDITREGIEEHRQAKMFLGELKKLTPTNKQYEAKLTVLMEDIEHHVKEEEGDMFKQAEDQLSAEALDRLAVRMEKEKALLVKAMPAAERAALNQSLSAESGKGAVQTMLEKAKSVVGGLLPGSQDKPQAKPSAKGKAASKTPRAASKSRTAAGGK